MHAAEGPGGDAERAWDRGAEAWTAFVRSGADYYRTLVHGPALLEACGDVSGLEVLDLGCGEGYFCRELARGGARVTGVDLSGELIRRARELSSVDDTGIDFVHADARDVVGLFGPQRFGLVTSCMAVQDMDDGAAVLKVSHDVLEPDGRFVFSVPHPATDTPYREWQSSSDGEKEALRIDRYFDTGPALMDWSMARLLYRWSTPHHRRTLEEWFELLRRSGFRIEGLREPRPGEDVLRREPRLADCSRVPYFLIWSAVRA